MLVEDNALVRRSMEAALRGNGYRVIAVDSGRRCIEAVEVLTYPVALLITDVVMPEMNGKELIERVRSLRPGLPVLFMSGYDQFEPGHAPTTRPDRALPAKALRFLGPIRRHSQSHRRPRRGVWSARKVRTRLSPGHPGRLHPS